MRIYHCAKVVVTSCLLLLVFLLTPVHAQQATAQAQTAPGGVSPSSPFFFLDRFLEELQIVFTLNPQAKARLRLEFAAERLAEVKLEIAAQDARGLDVALTNLRQQLAQVFSILNQQQAQGVDVAALTNQAQVLVEQQEEELDDLVVDEEVKIQGPLVVLTDEEMIVAGLTLTRSVLTKIEAAVAVGKNVEVKAVPQADGTLLARKVELSDEAQIEIKVEGILTSLTDTTATVVGFNLTLTPQTKREGNLVVGAVVKAKAIPQEDGTLLATKIEAEDGLEAELEVKIKLAVEDIEEESQVLTPLLPPPQREGQSLKREAREAEKVAREAAKALRKISAEASKAAEKAAKEEQKAVEKRAKEEAKSLREIAKQAEKQVKEVEKSALEAQKRSEEVRSKIEEKMKKEEKKQSEENKEERKEESREESKEESQEKED